MSRPKKYDIVHDEFILQELLHDTPERGIIKRFNKRFSKTKKNGLSKAYINRLKNRGKQRVESGQSPNLTLPEVTGQIGALIENKVVDTVKVRSALIYDMMGLVYDDKIEAIEKIKRLMALTQPLLKACDGLDRVKGLMPEIHANQVQINQININDLSDEQFDKFLPKFAEQMCAECLIKKEWKVMKDGNKR